MPAFIFHLLIIFPSGSHYCFKDTCGIFFWGAHGHDAIWHLALAESAFKTIPFNLPIFAGAELTGYNYLFDFMVFLVSRLGLSTLFIYFKLFPIVWLFLITILSIKLARLIKDSPLFVSLFLFFVYFGGSFGYILTYLHKKTLINSSSLMAMQSGHTLINPPFAFSLICLLAILIVLNNKKINLKNYLMLGLLLFLILGFKFYGGVIAVFVVLVNFTLRLLKAKKLREFIAGVVIVGLGIFLALFIFYDPLSSSKSGAVFTFDPLATVHPFIEDQNLLYMKDKVLQRYYLQEYGIGPRLIYIETLTLSLFLLFNFGTRSLGLLYLGYGLVKKKISSFDISVVSGIVMGILLSTFLVQKGEWWNTIQFLYYSIFLANIYAALAVYNFLKKSSIVKWFIAAIILILTIPINLDLIYQFSQFPAPSYLPKEEVEALAFLKKQPNGVVLTDTYDKEIRGKYSAPYPLFAYDDTAYVSAFSGQKTYLANITQLRLTGINYKNRLSEIDEKNCNVLDDIDYIYELTQQLFVKDFGTCQEKLKIIFNSKAATIYSKTK